MTATYLTTMDVIHRCLRLAYMAGEDGEPFVPESIDGLLRHIETRGMPEFLILAPDGHLYGRWHHEEQ